MIKKWCRLGSSPLDIVKKLRKRRSAWIAGWTVGQAPTRSGGERPRRKRVESLAWRRTGLMGASRPQTPRHSPWRCSGGNISKGLRPRTRDEKSRPPRFCSCLNRLHSRAEGSTHGMSFLAKMRRAFSPWISLTPSPGALPRLVCNRAVGASERTALFPPSYFFPKNFFTAASLLSNGSGMVKGGSPSRLRESQLMI